MDLGLKSKTVLVTGGNSGIGKAIALGFAQESGVNIAITYHQREDAANDVVQEIQRLGCEACALQLNLEEPSQISRCIDFIVNRFGSLHTLINNAVYWGDPTYRGSRFEDIPLIHWQKMIRTNLLGTISVLQSAIPMMKKQHFGRIVSISSDLAMESMVGSGPYSTVKAALTGLNANLVSELSSYNILSNVVLPSLTMTENATRQFSKTFQDAAKTAFPTARITKPEEVASLVNYLGSAANGHINGESIRVTGKGSQAMLSKIFADSTT